MPGEESNPRQILFKDMVAAAGKGDLSELQAHLTKWDTETNDGIPATSRDSSWFIPTILDRFEVFNELDRPHETTKQISTGWYIFNRLLIAASAANHGDIVRYLLVQRGCPITSGAVQTAMKKDAFETLEIFLENGWGINQPMRNNLCPILK